MKIATAAYPLDPLPDWAAYKAKLTDWVSNAAGQGAEILVFPEYGALELSMLAGPDIAGDLEGCLRATSDLMGDVDDLHSDLAARYNVHILSASAPVFDEGIGPRPVNRTTLFAPGGGRGVQDKQIMTRFERTPWDVVGGGGLQVFDTALGKIAVLICYDSEFPLLARAVSDAELLLVPSCTDTLAGYSRVRIGAMARALEGQCVSAMASLVGDAPWSPAVDVNVGMGGIFGPPDHGFPPTGVIAEGVMNRPGWTIGEVDLGRVGDVRADGGVLNRAHWADQAGRDDAPAVVSLR
ncbi:carbon-nitrogen hydrolase family protein [Roseovarius nanhaiticus]|uniref:carbon-nitrogen hydrolase family protein n=1 Tax=Roseovarius nanhaiticus TaxID=573024 RepID=UPI0024922F89|nr:carbon-nitrogen hydrolase family protein [Roseovarius nanhaiticus]